MKLSHFINRKNIKRYHTLVKDINQAYETLDTNNTLSMAEQFLELKNNTSYTPRKKTILAMALAKKAAKDVLGMTYYDVQLMGALALIDGAMAEMKTGEGKTLTCSAAVAANYVLGYHTHVATANEYLAKRDEETLRKLYDAMGIKSGFNISTMDRLAKKEVYARDVVYSTAQELGFDFLRDNLIYNLDEKLQPLDFHSVKCIIDEADFVLIDEARTPLIISGESPVKDGQYIIIRDIAARLKKIKGDYNVAMFEDRDENGDFWLDEKQKNVYLSDKGYAKLESINTISQLALEHDAHPTEHHKAFSLYDNANSWIINEILNSLKAQYLYIRDKDYIVQDGEIVIIDQNTGRLSQGRTWSNGLHQAIEAKENVKINPETITLGSISIQNYFRNYFQISGMSGTIMQSSEEFEEIYSCKTIQIPTNKKVVRHEHQDQIYLNTQSKYASIIDDIMTRHSKQQPILIGTTSVAESEIISHLLTNHNIPHHVLNAKNNALEAQIIGQAGQPGRVTVATSMAGRGTDIILGGNRESIHEVLDNQLSQIEERISFATYLTSQINVEANIQIQIEPVTEIATFKTTEEIQALYQDEQLFTALNTDIERIWNTLYNLRHRVIVQKDILEKEWQNWRNIVVNAGGLCVIGSSRNESRRIDDQLKGRSARQGDPGESIFYMSLEDSWVNIFGKNAIFAHLIKTLPEDQTISSPTVVKVFAKAQRNIESHHFDIRKSTYQYDSIADEGRKKFLGLRNNLLTNHETLKGLLYEKLMTDLNPLMSDDFLEFLEMQHGVQATQEDVLSYDLDNAYYLVQEFLDSDLYHYKNSNQDSPILEARVNELLTQTQDTIWSELNQNLLTNLDEGWSNHLAFIDDAQKNVAFAGLAQKNPVYEYRKICFQSFSSMLTHFKNKLVDEFFDKVLPVETSENDNLNQAA